MIGHDATDQIDGNHSREIILKKMPRFKIATLDVEEISLLEKDYRDLAKQLNDQGYYNTDYWFYLKKVAFLSLVFVATISLMIFGKSSFF
jgi:hypothetical protein